MIQRVSVVAATAALLASATTYVATQGGPGQGGVPALEYDFSGRWVPINHEDMINRTFGGELGDFAVVHQDDVLLGDADFARAQAVRGAHKVIAVHGHEELRFDQLHHEFQVFLGCVAGRVDVHEARVVHDGALA